MAPLGFKALPAESIFRDFRIPLLANAENLKAPKWSVQDSQDSILFNFRVRLAGFRCWPIENYGSRVVPEAPPQLPNLPGIFAALGLGGFVNDLPPGIVTTARVLARRRNVRSQAFSALVVLPRPATFSLSSHFCP